jgi:DNA-binding transcriptional ArsR family regulator
MSATQSILNKQWTQISKFFAVMSDPSRIMILLILRSGKLRVAELHEEFNKRTNQKLTRPAISHHLKVLADANFITAERVRQSIYYQINSQDLLEEMNIASQSISRTFPNK